MNVAEITIQGKVFNVPSPYTAGHVLNENEASVLNQTYHENIRNNFAGQMKKAEEAGKELGQTELDAYTSTYVFGIRGAGPAREADPVKAEAKRIIRGKLTEALKKQGKKPKDLPEGDFEKLVNQALERRPEFLAQAQKIVEAKRGAAASLDNLLDAAA